MTSQPAAGVDVSQVATLLNLTPRRIQQLAKEGVIPKAARGRYNLAGCVRAYVTYLQNIVERQQAQQAKVSTVEVQREKALKLAAEREFMEMRVHERKGELAPVAEMDAAVERLATAVRNEVAGLRSRFTLAVLGLQTPVEAAAVLDDMARQILGALAGAASADDEPDELEEAA